MVAFYRLIYEILEPIAGKTITLSDLADLFATEGERTRFMSERLNPLFENKKEFEEWSKNRMTPVGSVADLASFKGKELFLGIDSGSTTTKVVLMDSEKNIGFTFYSGNGGNPIGTVKRGLLELNEKAKGIELNIVKTGVTGYGEDLIKAAFGLDIGQVETIAHYRAAKEFQKDVSFIMDIGGQDMKAIFIDEGIISNIEINEACSSGCGSFIETFA